MIADAVQVLVNGEMRRLAAGTSIEGLVRELGRDPRTVAVEYNGDILARDLYATTRLNAGDRVEIVHFVQGG